MANSATWHYESDGRRQGPLTFEELKSRIRSGRISRDTLVWTEGMDEWRPVRDMAELAPAPGPPPLPRAMDPLHQAPAAPPSTPGPIPADAGDETGGIIPYKNPAALIAYYCGVFAIVPFFPIGLAGLCLGIIGLRSRKRNPVIKGAAHAWIGIIMGGLFGLLWLVLTVILVAGPLLMP